jgi:hypothetical protein
MINERNPVIAYLPQSVNVHKGNSYPFAFEYNGESPEHVLIIYSQAPYFMGAILPQSGQVCVLQEGMDLEAIDKVLAKVDDNDTYEATKMRCTFKQDKIYIHFDNECDCNRVYLKILEQISYRLQSDLDKSQPSVIVLDCEDVTLGMGISPLKDSK